jgi:hypothetical protein
MRGIAGAGVLAIYDKFQELVFGRKYGSGDWIMYTNYKYSYWDIIIICFSYPSANIIKQYKHSPIFYHFHIGISYFFIKKINQYFLFSIQNHI